MTTATQPISIVSTGRTQSQDSRHWTSARSPSAMSTTSISPQNNLGYSGEGSTSWSIHPGPLFVSGSLSSVGGMSLSFGSKLYPSCSAAGQLLNPLECVLIMIHSVFAALTVVCILCPLRPIDLFYLAVFAPTSYVRTYVHIFVSMYAPRHAPVLHGNRCMQTARRISSAASRPRSSRITVHSSTRACRSARWSR